MPLAALLKVTRLPALWFADRDNQQPSTASCPCGLVGLQPNQALAILAHV